MEQKNQDELEEEFEFDEMMDEGWSTVPEIPIEDFDEDWLPEPEDVPENEEIVENENNRRSA